MRPIDTLIEAVLTCAAWLIQLGITAAFSLLLGAALSVLDSRIRRRKVSLFPRAIAVFLILGAILAALAVKPPVCYPEEFRGELTAEMHDAVQSQSSGLYAPGLPLVPAYAKITNITDGRVYYRVQYLYFGYTEMSFSTTDGYNCEKPLLPT